MLKGLIVALGLAVTCTGFATDASARSKWQRWESEMLQRLAGREKCDGAGAPAWGKASMERWRRAERRRHRSDSR